MTRIARIVIPNCPHHIIQRGNRRQRVFFSDDDKLFYLNTLNKYAKKKGLKFWAFCLMDNHVHLIVVPEFTDSLAKGLGDSHRRYSLKINGRENWRGYLWEGRFQSYPLDEKHLYSAIRYVELNPVRAGIVKKAEEYPWSSAYAHINYKKHFLLDNNIFISHIPDWAAYLKEPVSKKEEDEFRKCATTGRPLGNEDFIRRIELLTGKTIRKKKPGPAKFW